MSLINQIDSEREFAFMYDIIDKNGDEKEQYFFHSDHLGSSSWITDVNGDVNQHLHCSAQKKNKQTARIFVHIQK